jgi:hypothetical protein
MPVAAIGLKLDICRLSRGLVLFFVKPSTLVTQQSWLLRRGEKREKPLSFEVDCPWDFVFSSGKS